MVDAAIDELISLKPYLSDPLRFYERAVRFYDGIHGADLPVYNGTTIYPQGRIPAIIERFTDVINLPQGSLLPLQQALELGELDITRLPRCEVPAFTLPYAEDDLIMLLYLIGRPYFRGLRERNRCDDQLWTKGTCPVCESRPVISSLGPDGRRTVYCSFCGTTGYIPRESCPACLSTDSDRLEIMTYQGEDGYSLQVCETCRSYGKIVEEERLASLTPDLADLISLPLDILVQQQGYSRRAPNPIGMLRMSANG